MSIIANGIDHLQDYSHLFKGKRVGLITNPSGVTIDLKATADIMAADFNLTVLFGPEHGIRGAAQAGVSVGTELDPILGIPVISLFGKTPRITPEQFEMFDVLAYDIQDVGSRFYTYLYTLSYAMEGAAKAGKPVVVFDRINPIGGSVCEGVILDYRHIHSFVGLYPMPARYGLTIGEYARYINETFAIHCDLTVVPCDKHDRDMLFNESGQLWVAPSPNIPTPEAALAYVGTCIYEGTQLSEGRGTTHPFEFIGAPFIQANRLADRLNDRKLPGIIWRPMSFTPIFQKYKDELCQGVQLHIRDAHTARPFEAALWLLHEIRQDYPFDVHFRKGHFNNILGISTYLTGQLSTEDVIQQARQDSAAFAQETARFRLY